MSNVIVTVQDLLSKAAPIRKLTDADLVREIAAMRPLQDLLEPKKVHPAPKAAEASKSYPSSAAAPSSPSQALKAGAPRSYLVAKGSIYSKRVKPIGAPAPEKATAPRASQPSVIVRVGELTLSEAATFPIEQRLMLKIRLQLCEAEKAGRDRSKLRRDRHHRTGQTPVNKRAGMPTASYCAKDVALAVPVEEVSGIINAKPCDAGHWLRQIRPGEVERAAHTPAKNLNGITV